MDTKALTVVSGSLLDLSYQNQISIAETFIGCDAIIIVDVSGSMEDMDSRGGKSRYMVACEELATIQKTLPGKIAVIAFSDFPQFVPSGLPMLVGRGTDMARALEFARVADVSGVRFILVSDGEPNDREQTLAIARKFHGRIDTVYVGPEAYPVGRDFLMQLSKLSGGANVTADRVKELAEKTLMLLGAGA